MTYTCTNDRYCPDAATFDSIEEFQEMCLACFGERAQLTDHGDTVTDETGEAVMRLRRDNNEEE